MGQAVTKSQTTNMILDYVSRLGSTSGVTLANEAVVFKLDVASITRIMATNPDEIHAFFGLDTVESQKVMTVILMPRKNGKYVKESGASEYLALESWEQISSIAHANNITGTTLATILS